MFKKYSSFFTFLQHLSLLLFILWLSGCAVEQKETEFVPPVYPSPPDEPRFYYETTLRSSADVIPADTDAKMKYLLTGAGRTSSGMSKPFGVAVRKGTIYVSDPVERHILVFDKTGKRFYRIGEKGPGQLKKPFGITLDNEGKLYVIDSILKKAFIYDNNGKFVDSIGKKEMFQRPSGIAVSKDGSRLYIGDTGGVSTQEHRIRVFDVNSKKHLFDIGTRGNKDGEFNLPKGMAISQTENLLYVVDSANFRVQAFNTETGEYVKQFGAIGRVPGKFARPKDLAIDKEGNIYVSDAAFGNFQIFNPKGQLLLFVGGRNMDNKPGMFMLPAGIDVDEDGRVLMTDQFFRKVEIFRPATLKAHEGYLGAPEITKK